VQEAERLIKNGFKEIVLNGICLGVYGGDLNPRIDLADVLERLEKIDSFIRLRLSSIEAWDISERLINILGSSKRVCPHLHIPIQSGDDMILNRMNRHTNAGDYLEVINRLKKTMPQLAITTDVIVGFPGEKEENFINTLELIREIEPLKVHIFPYSPRAGTAAFYLKDRVLRSEINRRVSYLRDIARECAFRYRSRFLNQSCRILIEGNSRKDKGFQEGFTDNYIRVRLLAERDFKNEFRNAVLKEIKEDFALAELA
jgi:threonylcarbamoyladenosine tRNA methylthiotransferase MtaB